MMHENDSYLEDLQNESEAQEEIEQEREEHRQIKEGRE